MMRKRLTRWLIGIAIALIFLSTAINPHALSFVGRWLDVGNPPQKADAVVLLNGGYNTRPFVAAALVHGGWAPKLILNTVAPHAAQISGAVPSSSEIVQTVFAYGGLKHDRVILLETAAQTTFDEAEAVADYLSKNPAHHILIVTEGPHTRRAEWIFRRTLRNQAVEITMISAPTDEFDAVTWWHSEAGFLFVVSEYFKLFFYALRYGWLLYELLAMAAAGFFLRTWFRRRRKLVGSGAI